MIKPFLSRNNISKGIKSIKKSFRKGKISEERLARSVKKILKAKYKVGLNNYKSVETINLIDDLNSISVTNLINKSIENIPTLIKNNNNVIPVKLDTESILNVQFGNDDGALFNDYLNKYGSIR